MPSGYGGSCRSAPNPCGITNSGRIGCSGGCTASTPAQPYPSKQTFQRVPSGGSAYLYYGANLSSSGLASRCHLLTNNSGQSIFVPTKTEPEFTSFIQSDANNGAIDGLTVKDVTP